MGGVIGSIANIGDSINFGRNVTPSEAAEEAASATAQEVNNAIARGDSATLREMIAETEEAKAERLRNASIKITAAKEGSGENFEKSMLSGVRKQDASKYLAPILRKLGIFTKYQNEALDVSFEYSGNALRRSTAHQERESGNEYKDFALVNANLKELCESAYPAEAHLDEKPPSADQHVKAAATLFSVLQDGNRIIPVKMTVKFFDNQNPTLHIVIAGSQTQNKSDSEDAAGTQNAHHVAGDTLTHMSVTDFLRLVNDSGQFTKRMPNLGEGIYSSMLRRNADAAPKGQQNAQSRMLYAEELLRRGMDAGSGIYAEALRKAELEKARKIADESGLKLQIQSLGVNQRGKHENRRASGENSKKPNKSFEDSEKSDIINKLGSHILDIAYISHDLHEMSEQIGAIMDKFSSRFSRWSGNTSIGRVADMPGVSGRKEWSCDITLREDAEIKTAVHEHLHARSASYYVPTQYRKWHNIEEGAVELYAQEICRQAGINFRESYKEEVKQLKIANSIMQLYDDHFKYAHDLFEIPMPERYAWLRSNANRAINNGRLSKKSIDALNYAIEFFNGRL